MKKANLGEELIKLEASVHKSDLGEKLTKIAARGLHEMRAVTTIERMKRAIPATDDEVIEAFAIEPIIHHAAKAMSKMIAVSLEAMKPLCSHCGEYNPAALTRTICRRCRP